MTSETNDEQYHAALKMLLQYTSLPFLELAVLSQLSEEHLGKIVDRFEQERLVRISNRADPFERIITIRPGKYEKLIRIYGR